MGLIKARSPYIVTINEASQVSTKIKLFISTTTFSGSPQYTLSKLIPSSNFPSTYYDIAPYLRSYFNFTTLPTPTVITSLAMLNVRFDKYKTVGVTETLVSSTTLFASDGYTEFTEGLNSDSYPRNTYLMDEKKYYVHKGAYAGFITAYLAVGDYVRYVSSEGTTVDKAAIITAGWYMIPKQEDEFVFNYTILIRNSANSNLATYYVEVVEECRYTPVIVDFVNKYGAWQREFFFKASVDTIEVQSMEYNALMPNINYTTSEAQKKTFNVNAKESIKVNTGWVEEDFKVNLKQLMLSERILLNGLPVNLKTKNMDFSKHLTTKQINYTLDFSYAYDTLNNII